MLAGSGASLDAERPPEVLARTATLLLSGRDETGGLAKGASWGGDTRARPGQTGPEWVRDPESGPTKVFRQETAETEIP